jgi:hypothetical protein
VHRIQIHRGLLRRRHHASHQRGPRASGAAGGGRGRTQGASQEGATFDIGIDREGSARGARAFQIGGMKLKGSARGS